MRRLPPKILKRYGITKHGLDQFCREGCVVCTAGMLKRAPVPHRSPADALAKRGDPDDLDQVEMVMDSFGPFSVPSAQYGYVYMTLVLLPKWNRFWLKGSRQITAADFERFAQEVRLEITFRIGRVKLLIVDGLKTTASVDFAAYLLDALMRRRQIPSYDHALLGVLERIFGQIVPAYWDIDETQ